MQIRIQIISVVLGLALWGITHGMLYAQDEASLNYAKLYEVKKGDTPESVAAHFLGDADFAEELLRFNHLSRQQFGRSYGKLITLPGASFPQAAQALLNCEAAIATATSKAAAEYATKEFTAATHLHNLAKKA